MDFLLVQFDYTISRKIICSGDIIGIGPKPEETVKKDNVFSRYYRVCQRKS